MNQLAVVTDFDGTFMEQDVGDTLMEMLKVIDREEFKQATERARNKQAGSMEWIHACYPFLEGRQGEVDQILEHIVPRKGALEFLEFCRNHHIPVTILSDGMQYYINRLLQKYGIEVDQVISNPIMYLEDGSYQLQVQNKNPACRWCGCCKADAVRQMKQAGQRIVYIGDGTSDYYGSSFADWVFARGTLAGFLQQAGTPYYPFETFDDVLSVLQSSFHEFIQGTAKRRMQTANSFCRFETDAAEAGA